MNNCAAVIVCAGKGERAKLGYNKIFYRYQGKTLLEHCLDKFDCPKIVVAAKQDLDQVKKIASSYSDVAITIGGSERTMSVKAGLELAKEYEYVLIHDGARPNVSKELIKRLIEACKKHDSAIPYIDIKDTVIQKTKNSFDVLDRQSLMALQTPQVFKTQKILQAYDNADAAFSDDSQVYARRWGGCHYVLGEESNYKITTSQDLLRLSQSQACQYRLGIGYDFHRLSQGRKLVLGGVNIPHELGLSGHSDADAAVHALMDSILSALGMADIGQLFPDNDPKYKDIYSVRLLEEVVQILKNQNADINNVSITILAQKPKLNPYIPQMKTLLAKTLGVTTQQIGITATTNEGCGAVGREEGIACFCSCLLRLYDN
ncbi:MAG: 2-C-methyl-D-erythritol 2,4-cyclodiphosphate synthase [Clostridiales bacterium]|nr:2-C-methyl-D-erythritol 2,4-cyclodiphosphate synthase [Clostridiales bacterium]